MIDMRESIAVQEERIAELESGGADAYTFRSPAARPHGVFGVAVPSMTTDPLRRSSSVMGGDSVPPANVVEIGGGLKLAITAAKDNGTLPALAKSFARVLTKPLMREFLPLISAAAAMRTQADSGRQFEAASSTNAQLALDVLAAIATQSAADDADAAADEVATFLLTPKAEVGSAMHTFLDRAADMTISDLCAVGGVDNESDDSGESDDETSPIPFSPVEELMLAIMKLDGAALLTRVFAHGDHGQYLGNLITAITKKKKNQMQIDELSLLVKVCGPVSDATWDKGVRPMLREIAASMKCTLTLKSAAQLTEMGFEHSAVKALLHGALSTEYSASGDEADLKRGIVFSLKAQLKQKLDDVNELRAAELAGAIAPPNTRGHGNSKDDPLLLVCALDQARIKVAAGIDQMTLAHVSVVVRILGTRPHSNDETMQLALYDGDDDLDSLLGHGQCDGTCSDGECHHMLGQLKELRETTSITLESGRVVWVKLFRFIVDGKSYRTILRRQRGASGWAVAWIESSCCTKEQILFMPFLGTSASAAATKTATTTQVAVGEGVQASDEAAAAAADVELAAAAVQISMDVEASTAYSGVDAEVGGTMGDGAFSDTEVMGEQRISEAATVFGISKDELSFIHYYAPTPVMHETNRGREDAPRDEDIYCSAPLSDHFPPSMTVHGTAQSITFTFSLCASLTPALSLSLSHRHPSLPLSLSLTHTHRHRPPRHRGSVRSHLPPRRRPNLSEAIAGRPCEVGDSHERSHRLQVLAQLAEEYLRRRLDRPWRCKELWSPVWRRRYLLMHQVRSRDQ